MTSIIDGVKQCDVYQDVAETTQTLSAACTVNDTYVTLLEYDSTEYVIHGGIHLQFPATESYDVKFTTVKSGTSEPEIPIDATGGAQARTYRIEPTEYLKVEVKRTADVGAVTVTGTRNLIYQKNTGIAAPTA